MFPLITQHLTEQASAALPLTSLCALVGVARATYYRQPAKPDECAMELRDCLQRLALEWPTYGYRRITAALRRRGFAVNRKRVLRLLRADNLLCLRRGRLFVVTTDSRHDCPVYPNLARELAVTNINQLWIADITYVRLGREWIYLAVILDAYSRRVIGWALSRHIDTELTLAALRMAFDARQIAPGLVHHSDRGVQYAATDYVAELHAHQITISMSRKGNPYDNAQCERFMRTLKYEEVYLSEYETLLEAEASIGRFLEEVYNRKRLHSALGYVPPVEFEQSLKQRVYP
jgi:transposase InsO family protein